MSRKVKPSSELLAILTARWETIGAKAEIRDDLFNRYCEPHRHYHTLEHLAEMFGIADRLAESITDPVAFEWAVWFHDAIYDPTRFDNEEKSAGLAAKVMRKAAMNDSVIEEMQRLILATKHAAQSTLSENAIVLLDRDLAILGAAWDRYRRYADDIHIEYSYVADSDFYAGRIRILESFLAWPRIFLTPLLFAELEAPARANLTDEIAALFTSQQT